MTKVRVRAWLPLVAAAGLVPLAAGRAPKAAEAEKPFVPIWITKKGVPTDEARQEALRELAAEEADPQHVVVLVHGFETPRRRSEKQYAQIAGDVHGEFGRLGERVSVLGVQWPSDVGPQRSWLPQSVLSYIFRKIGFKNAVRDPYRFRVDLARKIGRTGLREILFDVRERFPEARLHVFAHSLGTEMVLHAADPGLTKTRRDYRRLTFQPERKLQLDLVAVMGADADVDIASRTPPGGTQRGEFPMLLWQTLPKYGTRHDKVLDIRKIARGKIALGNDVPRLRAEQIDRLLGAHRLIFDTKNIPADHAFLHYYTQERIAQLAEAAAALRDPACGRSGLLTSIDQVLAAPNTVEGISPFLIGPETSPKIYALWRLERLLCGNSHHLENSYAQHVLAKTLHDPRWLDREREVTACKVVKEGLWPPSDVVARVRAAAEAKRRQRAEE